MANGSFAEWAKVFEHYYGTPKTSIEETLEQGQDILFDIDWQGTQQLSQSARGDLVTVFLLPPSLKILKDRLKNRAQDDCATVEYRMRKAHDEMSHWAEYSYVLINDDLDQTFERVRSILVAERLKRTRCTGLSNFVKSLNAQSDQKTMAD